MTIHRFPSSSRLFARQPSLAERANGLIVELESIALRSHEPGTRSDIDGAVVLAQNLLRDLEHEFKI